MHFCTKRLIEWHQSVYHYGAHSKIAQNVFKYRSIQILCRISERFVTFKRLLITAMAYFKEVS